MGGIGDDRGWDGWMASLTQWTWVWVNPWSWLWTGRPCMLQSMGSQRVGHDWATEHVTLLTNPITTVLLGHILRRNFSKTNWTRISNSGRCSRFREHTLFFFFFHLVLFIGKFSYEQADGLRPFPHLILIEIILLFTFSGRSNSTEQRQQNLNEWMVYIEQILV